MFYLWCWGETQGLTCARQMPGHWVAPAAFTDATDESMNIGDTKTIKGFDAITILHWKIVVISLFIVRIQVRAIIYFGTWIIQVLIKHEGNTGHESHALLLCTISLNTKSA